VTLVGFEQATIRIDKPLEFGELKTAIESAFAPERVEKLLATLKRKDVRIRDWDSVLRKRVLEKVEPRLAQAGSTAHELYRALTGSDQGQIRELYLSQLEQVSSALRHKFHKLYRDS